MLGHLGSLHFRKAPCVSSFFLLFLHQPKLQPENSQQTCLEFQHGPSLVLLLQACYFISFEIVFSSVKWAYSNLPQRLLGGLGGVKCIKHLVQCPDTAERLNKLQLSYLLPSGSGGGACLTRKCCLFWGLGVPRSLVPRSLVPKNTWALAPL